MRNYDYGNTIKNKTMNTTSVTWNRYVENKNKEKMLGLMIKIHRLKNEKFRYVIQIFFGIINH